MSKQFKYSSYLKDKVRKYLPTLMLSIGSFSTHASAQTYQAEPKQDNIETVFDVSKASDINKARYNALLKSFDQNNFPKEYAEFCAETIMNKVINCETAEEANQVLKAGIDAAYKSKMAKEKDGQASAKTPSPSAKVNADGEQVIKLSDLTQEQNNERALIVQKLYYHYLLKGQSIHINPGILANKIMHSDNKQDSFRNYTKGTSYLMYGNNFVAYNAEGKYLIHGEETFKKQIRDQISKKKLSGLIKDYQNINTADRSR